jgi:hypothetical protein
VITRSIWFGGAICYPAEWFGQGSDFTCRGYRDRWLVA